MAQTVIVVPCNICDTDQDVQFYCTHCEENLCTNCKNYHSKFKTTKNHQVIPISKARAGNITITQILCRDHSTEEVSIYCEKCNQLICIECLIGKHMGHNLTSLKQMKNMATDHLVKLRKTLRERKLFCDEILIVEGKVHTDYMAAIKQCRTDISDQKDKIIEELNIICEKEFAELTSLEEEETKRYSKACTNIQKHQEKVTTALQTVQNGKDSGHPASMLQVKEDAAKCTGELDDLTPAQLYSPKFQRAPIEGQALRQLLGSVHTKSGRAKTRDIDIDNTRTRSTIKVKDKVKCIKVIIPTKNDCIWVSAQGDNYLTLINDKGETIRTSVRVNDCIEDAKAYNNDILLTCKTGHQVFRLSGEGTKKSVFSNLQPYYTNGLWVTNEMDVLVCLYSDDRSDKVVRLGKMGEIIQTIQKDRRGRSLYIWPYRVTAVPTGEILVTQAEYGNVICVNRDGQHLFTWTGQGEGRQIIKYGAHGIAQDSHNVFVTDHPNSKLYVLKKDGTGTKCLLDSTHGIQNPLGLALNDCGQLLVGCNGGKIHVIEY